MQMQNNFLLISEQVESIWFHNWVKALTRLGKLQVLPQEKALQSINKRKYDVIIIDVATTDDERSLISRIHTEQPQARIVVTTVLPTWRRAREVFHSGAMDYINKALGEKELYSAFKDILAKNPRLWPQ